MIKKHTKMVMNCGQWFILSVIYCISFMNSLAQDAAVIDIDETYQIIRGFGAANIMPWRPDMTADEIETAFGTEDGQLGFSILRLRVPVRESEFDLNVATAKAAHERGVTLIASPWSPPPSMKTNGSTVGGALNESKYEDFADYLNTFVDFMADNDAPLYAISVQNEPDIHVSYESCDYTAAQMLKFVKEQGGRIQIKLMAPESYKFNKSMSDPVLNDSVACANLGMVCGHIYGGGRSAYPLVMEKGKESWMTEYLINSDHLGANMDTSWVSAMETAQSIHDCMKSNMSAYVWWYIVRFYGPISDGTLQPKGEMTQKGYAMSHYSRFIRPGYYRIGCDPYPQSGVYLTAYKDDTSSQIVIVALNRSSMEKVQTFTLQNGNTERFTSYVTTNWKNCRHEKDYSVVNGSFAATLEASSVTTFVSDHVTVDVENASFIPEFFGMLQSYPNPFNPVTTIEYSVPMNGPVSLKVYNPSGKEVQTLFKGYQYRGDYAIQFDGGSLPSGVYVCRLNTNRFAETEKLILIK